MRKLMCFLVITVTLFFILLNAFAGDGKQSKLDTHEDSTIDNSKFITFKGEEGQVKIFKTLASLRVDKGQIKFEVGEFIPIYKEQTSIPDYRKYFE
ncbi:MAG: hypothetical protein WBD99_16185 [Thermodesulfobacteriota bacterium]